MINKKVVVGMSGGVDSSVAAYILKEEGYDVVGVTMQIWQDEGREEKENNAGCCGLSAVDDARRVSEILDIPYYVLNFKDTFDKNVVSYFVNEYLEGKTPNPCIACNKYVKWESLLNKSLQIGASYIATGHYAHVVKYPLTQRYTLKVSNATGKDQTYALYNLSQFQLEHTLMPLWSFEKSEVREIAEKIGLCVANKPDSQEICFVPDNKYGNFIEKYTNKPSISGDYINIKGEVIGQHKGIIHYTIGQRKGLGMGFGAPMYVKKINKVNNTILLVDDNDLFETHLYAENLNFMAIENLVGEMKVKGKIRYAHTAVDCLIKMDGDKLLCIFETPQRAITAGQAVVFYLDDYIICGGTIL